MTEILIPVSTDDDVHDCVSEGAEIRRLKDMITKVSNKHNGEFEFELVVRARELCIQNCIFLTGSNNQSNIFLHISIQLGRCFLEEKNINK